MCKCLQENERELAQINLQFVTVRFPLRNGKMARRIAIQTVKINRRKDAVPVQYVASYCPFCGDRLEEENDGS